MSEESDSFIAALPDRYEIGRELGRGGMAIVYLACDLKHSRDVAVKVLLPELAAAVGAERFLREIEITAQLNHPHILPLLDSGATDGLLYYVMPYVPGGSLRHLLASDQRLSVDTVLRVTREVASALDYANSRGVIHRDIKPENILFSEGLAVVADFGIARVATGAARQGLTRTGMPVGTPGYMSPEQALGTSELDARTDVYGLGCVVYEMLVGATPAVWPGTEDVRLGRLSEVPDEHRARLDALPGRMEQVLTRALALRAADRFAQAGELSAALTAASERTPSLSQDEVQRLLERAAQLEAQQPTKSGALSLGAVEQVAAEVGIPPEHVRRAARELRRPEPAPVSPRTYKPSSFDPRGRRIKLDRVVEGEVRESVYAGMVEEVQARLDLVGHASVLAGSLTWSPVAHGDASRDVVVTVTPREGQTHIRVEERFRVAGFKAAFLPAGGIFSAVMAAAMIQALGISEPVGPLLAIGSALAGVFFSARLVIWYDANAREPELESVANRLAELAERAVDPVAKSKRRLLD